MKLVEIARGHIVLEAYGKSIKIYGEVLLRGHGSPDFVVYSNSIDRWDLPDDHGKIPDAVKNEILEFLQAEFLKRNMTIEIE
jgi:hypothetical protein